MPVSFSVRLCLAFSVCAAHSHSRFLMKLREESVTVELKNGGVVQGQMAKHCVLLEHVSMQSCCLISYNRWMGSQHISRHCYRSGPRHEHAHEECQVHCQGQKPRVFGAPLCSWQHGVFFPLTFFCLFVSFSFIRPVLLSIRHAGLTCFKVRCYILPDTLRFVSVCLILFLPPLVSSSKLPILLSHTFQLGYAPRR